MFQKVESSPTKGYQLFNLGQYWELHSSTGIFRGNLRKVCTYAVVDLGFAFRELEVAVERMEDTGDNGAEFGVYKSFMFTFKKDSKYAKIVVH